MFLSVVIRTYIYTSLTTVYFMMCVSECGDSNIYTSLTTVYFMMCVSECGDSNIYIHKSNYCILYDVCF